jgi:hypothetical protein
VVILRELTEGKDALPIAAAQLYAYSVNYDRHEPGRHSRPSLEPGNVLESGQHRILHGILCIFSIAEPADRQSP